MTDWIEKPDLVFRWLGRTPTSAGRVWDEPAPRLQLETGACVPIKTPWTGAKVSVPALYIVGEHDLVLRFAGIEQLLSNLSVFVPKLQKTARLLDCGHWTQQEKPSEVNALLIKFLKELDLD